MKRFITILMSLFATAAFAQFPVSTSSKTVDISRVSGNYDSFKFNWIGENDQLVKFYFTNSTQPFSFLPGNQVGARICRSTTVYVDIAPSNMVLSDNMCQFSVARTNLPPNSDYDMEVWLADGTVTNQARTLAQGFVTISKSLYQNTNFYPFPSTPVDLSAYLTIDAAASIYVSTGSLAAINATNALQDLRLNALTATSTLHRAMIDSNAASIATVSNLVKVVQTQAYTLARVLTNGSSAGGNSINMNGNNISNAVAIKAQEYWGNWGTSEGRAFHFTDDPAIVFDMNVRDTNGNLIISWPQRRLAESWTADDLILTQEGATPTSAVRVSQLTNYATLAYVTNLVINGSNTAAWATYPAIQAIDMDGKPVNNLPLATNALSAVALMQMNLSNNVQNNTMTAMGQTTDIALAQIVIVNAALAAQTNAIVWMGRTNDSQSARLTSNETHLTALDATNTSQWTSINAAHLTNALQQMTINSHTARILTNENSITGLNASNNSFAARILTNENSITGLNASNNSFTARILTNENAIAGLNASNNSFAARILTNENLTVLAITNILVTAPSGTGTVTRAGQVATVSFPVAGVASSQVPIIVSNIVQGTVITYTNRPRRTAELTAHSQWHQISPYIVNGRYSYSPNLVGANSYLERVRRYGPITFTAPVQPVSISGRVGWSVEAADIGYVKYGSVYWYELVPIDKPTFSWGTVPATVLEVFASNYTLGTDRAYVSGVFVNSPLMQRAWPGVRTNTISSYSLSQVTPATSYYIDVYACNMEMNMQGTTDAIYEKYPIAADQLSYSGPIYHTYTQYLTNAIFTIKYQDPQPPSGPGY